jgi:hypothetical protein
MNIHTGAKLLTPLQRRRRRRAWKEAQAKAEEPPKKRGPDPEKPSEMVKAYAERRAAMPNEFKKDSAVAVGYSPNTSPTYIEATKGFRYAMMSVDRQREAIGQEEELSFEGVARRVVARAKDPMVTPGVQTDNDKLLIGMMGYSAPTVAINKNATLVLEFNDLSSADIDVLKAGLRPE